MRKLISFAVSLALLSLLLTAHASAADALEEQTSGAESNTMSTSRQIIFDIDFDDATMTAAVGAATEGSNKGTYAVSFNGTMAYQFNSSYFKPTAKDGTPLLTGLDEFTVSYWAKTESSTRNWTLFAAPDTSTQSYQKEKYIGLRDNGTNILSERYNNNGSRPSNIDVSGLKYGWKHIVLVQKQGSFELYINGELGRSQTSSYSVSGILGDNSVIQVGKGNWESGEYASGVIDNYKIFNYALDADEIESIYNDECTPVFEWETAVDSVKTGEGDSASGTLRFLAAVMDDNSFDISKGEYGFVFVNVGTDNVKYFTGSGARSGLNTKKAYYIDIVNIPLSVTKVGFYAVPYVTLENGYVVYGPSFAASELNWVAE